MDARLTEADWDSIDECIATLEPFKKYSLKLQKETCTLSDFFGYWMTLKLKMSTKFDDFSKELLKQMNERHEMLMQNPAVIAAVYLDPRYQRALKDEKSLAVEVLATIHSKMQALEQNEEDVHETATDCDDMDMMFQRYLDSCDINDHSPNQDIKSIIKSFDNFMVEPVHSSVLSFWERMKLQLPELYDISTAVTAIPPTQATVERAFSALGLILTSRRTKIGDTILQNILLIRFNKNLM